MIFLKNKMILFEAILIAVIIGSAGLYVADFNNSHFEPIKNMDLNNINQWNHGKRLEVTESNGIMKITSDNNVYASWPLLNSRGFDVHPGETILLSLYAKYSNTAQSTLRLIGNTSKGESILGYAFGANGNGSWHYYSLKITIPAGVSSVFIQLSIGWVISSKEPEVIMLKDMTLYKINAHV